MGSAAGVIEETNRPFSMVHRQGARREQNYCKTSNTDKFNNCAGFAAGDSRWWQPPIETWHYWPPGAPRDWHIKSYVKAYEIEGFSVCDDGSVEEGYDKIALYARNDLNFQHAAKQNSDGSWSSKLGRSEDIWHENLEVLAGNVKGAYGEVRYYMKRQKHYAETHSS
jgi:hypothetical protein